MLLAGCVTEAPKDMPLYRAPAIANTIAGVVFEAGNWEPHLAAGAENQPIDGLYLDDIAFSRETVKRMVAVLSEHRNMEHFPFISRLRFGEGFDYDQGPDYWMTEVAGLPFGLMGEMLQDGGHPYRGMLYGMTARKYGNVDPRPVWRAVSGPTRRR